MNPCILKHVASATKPTKYNNHTLEVHASCSLLTSCFGFAAYSFAVVKSCSFYQLLTYVYTVPSKGFGTTRIIHLYVLYAEDICV